MFKVIGIWFNCFKCVSKFSLFYYLKYLDIKKNFLNDIDVKFI